MQPAHVSHLFSVLGTASDIMSVLLSTIKADSQRKSWLDYFAIGLVNSVLARRVSEVFEGIQITEELLSILFIKICFPG